MHVHVSVLDALVIGAMVLIWMWLFRLTATSFSEASIGQALAVIH